jgi:acyl carrier protein
MRVEGDPTRVRTDGSADLRAQVRRLVIDQCFFGDASVFLANDTSLEDTGALDSLGVLALRSALEETYGVTLTDDDLTPEHFDSIGTLAQLVESKLRTAEG